jgi:Fur family ferric uptake transcriptional regulator
MSHESIDVSEILHTSGFRVTPQRLIILDAVCQGNGHTRIGDICSRTSRMDPSIDRSTVYRALSLFQQVGLVLSSEIDTGEKVYEIAESQSHYHLTCRECGQTELVDQNLTRPFIEMLEELYGFTISADHHVIFGMCTDCK